MLVSDALNKERALFLWEANFSAMAGRLDLKRSADIDRDSRVRGAAEH
jgi:hypothetical protein